MNRFYEGRSKPQLTIIMPAIITVTLGFFVDDLNGLGSKILSLLFFVVPLTCYC